MTVFFPPQALSLRCVTLAVHIGRRKGHSADLMMFEIIWSADSLSGRSLNLYKCKLVRLQHKSLTVPSLRDKRCRLLSRFIFSCSKGTHHISRSHCFNGFWKLLTVLFWFPQKTNQDFSLDISQFALLIWRLTFWGCMFEIFVNLYQSSTPLGF